MKRLVALMMCAVSLGAAAQITYPYNPDGNADGDIAVGDLQDFLVTYGNPFSPSEIMVGDTMLSEWVYFLSSTLLDQQAVISNLQSQFADLSDVGGANLEGLAFGLRQSFNPWQQNFDTLETYKLYTTIDFAQDGFLSFDVSCGNATFLLLPDSISLSDYSSDFFLEQSAIRRVEFPDKEVGIPIKSSERGVIVKSTCCSCLDLDWNWLPLSPSTSSEIDSLSNVIAQLDSIVQIIEPFLGCTDTEACNYDFAVIDAGNCQYSDCLGVCGGEAQIDECGVCNGSGPSIPIIESIETVFDSLYAEQIDEWLVFEVGADTIYQYVCGLGCTDPLAENYNDFADTDDGSCFYTWACGNPLEYQGHEYETVLIGQQCWFAENLATPFYQSGGTIPLAGDQYTPGNWRTPYGFGNQSCTSSETYFDACNPSESIVRYGLLYNHQTAMSGICPNGWKLPSNVDWEILLAELGDENPADELKSEQYWNGDNGSQFNAVPAGNRNDVGGFYNAGQSTRFWSSDIFEGPPYYGTSWSFEITNSSAGLTPIWLSDWGHSVRCIKDAE